MATSKSSGAPQKPCAAALSAPQRRGHRFHNARVHVRALAGGDVYAHAGAAEYQRALELALGNLRADPQPDAVEHVLGVVHIRVGDAHIGNRPALGPQVGANGLLQRIAGEVCPHQKLFVLDRLQAHPSFPVK